MRSKLGEITPAELGAMATLYRSGHSTQVIGEYFGRSTQSVWRALVRAGVEMREPGWQPKPDRPRPLAIKRIQPAWHPMLPDADECRARLERLTPSQLRALSLLAGGHSTSEIASQLNVSISTVRNTVCMAYDRLGIRPTTLALALYRRAGEGQADDDEQLAS